MLHATSQTQTQTKRTPLLPLRFLFVLALVLLFTITTHSVAQEESSPPAPEETPTAQPTPDHLLAASDGTHLWFVKQPIGTSGSAAFYTIQHHASPMSPATFGTAVSVKHQPEAIIAVDSRLFLIFPSSNNTLRSVVTIKATSYDTALERWRYQPSDSVQTLPGLPAGGQIIATVSLRSQYPCVLIKGETGLTLYQYDATDWIEKTLPADLNPDQSSHLFGGSHLRILSSNILHEWGPDTEQWTTRSIDIDPSKITQTTLWNDHPVFVETTTVNTKPVMVLSYLSRESITKLGSFPDQSIHEKLIPLGDTLVLIEQKKTDDPISLSLLDYTSGQFSESKPLTRPRSPGQNEFGPFILIIGLVLAALIMFLSRPDPTRVQITLPPGTLLAEPSKRLTAVIIDLIPAGFVVMLLMQVPFNELIRSPLVGRDFNDVAPPLAMIILCVIHSTISEIIWGRTLGKMLLDCRVLAINGQSPNAVSIIIRNLMKCIAMVVPPLVLFVYLNPARQRLGDQVARTVVINDPIPEDQQSE